MHDVLVNAAAGCRFGAYSARPRLRANRRRRSPGVKTPGVKIPIERLKPDAVFPVPGTPDWLAIDEHVVGLEQADGQRVALRSQDEHASPPPARRRQAPVLGPRRRLRQPLGAQLRRPDDLPRRSEDRRGDRHDHDRHRQLRRLDRGRRRQRLDGDRRQGHARALRSGHQRRRRRDLRRPGIVRTRRSAKTPSG